MTMALMMKAMVLKTRVVALKTKAVVLTLMTVVLMPTMAIRMKTVAGMKLAHRIYYHLKPMKKSPVKVKEQRKQGLHMPNPYPYDPPFLFGNNQHRLKLRSKEENRFLNQK